MSEKTVALEMYDKFSPNDFVVDQHYWNTFGQSETESSARWIVMFLQDRNDGWKPFTIGEIRSFYGKRRRAVGKPDDGYTFNRLIDEHRYGPWIAVRGSGEHGRLLESDVCTVMPTFIICLLGEDGALLKSSQPSKPETAVAAGG